MKLVFGIYPGGAVGSDSSSVLIEGKPNVPHLITKFLDDLHSSSQKFLVRTYVGYKGNGQIKSFVPDAPVQYATENRKLDMVLCYQPAEVNMQDWTAFVEKQIASFGQHLAKIQIAEEPNLHNVPSVDGDSPGVMEAVIEGVVAAKKEIIRRNFDIQVGFNAVPTFDPSNGFWRELGESASAEFISCLDYVGVDFFPDVFRPVPFNDLDKAIELVLNLFRNTSLPEANIPAGIPLHITENGWPTSPERSEKTQALVLDKIVRRIAELGDQYNVTHYELFDLRDADSENPNFFNQFGILRDDYTQKPAYSTFRELIAELG